MNKRERKQRRLVQRWAANILALYLDAPDATRAAGAVWYAEESARLEDWARRHGVTLSAAAGAAAAISPGMRWELVPAYLDALRSNPRAKVPTYSREFVRRASVILRGGDVATELSGPKVTAFYALLARVNMDAVVIDGHALNIARGEAVSFRRRPGYEPPPAARVNACRYRLCAEAYREVAEIVGAPPHAVQATTWIYWRELLDSARRAR